MVKGPMCGGNKRQGEGTCQRPAGWGTDHPGHGRCKLHGGMLRGQRQAAEKALAVKTATVWGVPRHIDPADGLLEEYWRSAGIVLGLERIVATIKDEELVYGVVEVREHVNGSDPPPSGQDSAAGPTQEVIRKVAPNIWLRLFNEERDRWAKLGIDIVRLNLEARREEYIRAQVEVFAQVLLAPALALTAAQRQTAAQLLRGLGAKPDVIDVEEVA